MSKKDNRPIDSQKSDCEEQPLFELPKEKHDAFKEIALHVKLNDMRNNMDISRISNPTTEDYTRLERYKKEYEILIQMLRDYYGSN